ncbi:MAG: N-acyl homoserine lactonase family protein [Synergistaceae bacterium]|nr:N-acyl homoserine lactonase family protein [Synergistaceae bacterium]
MRPMKLFVMDGGKIILPPHHYLGAKKGKGYSIPIPIFLIEHPEGLVLFDTGPCIENWPDVMKPDGVSAPEQRIDRQLKALGYSADNVNIVIISHLHLDHAGGVTFFPNATFIIRESEFEAAFHNPSGGYVPADYEQAHDFTFIKLPNETDYDVFGDGRLMCIDTKGHTAGHQSLLVDLPDMGKILIAVDAAQLEEDMSSDQYPEGQNWSDEWYVRSLAKLRDYKAQQVPIWYGHDPDQFKTLRLTPAFYS